MATQRPRLVEVVVIFNMKDIQRVGRRRKQKLRFAQPRPGSDSHMTTPQCRGGRESLDLCQEGEETISTMKWGRDGYWAGKNKVCLSIPAQHLL